MSNFEADDGAFCSAWVYIVFQKATRHGSIEEARDW